MPSPRCLLTLAFLACAPATARAADPAYRFDKLAETGTTYSALGRPALNDAGVAAFTASNPSDPNTDVTRVSYGVPALLQQVPTARR